MSKTYYTTIGLEVHAELHTNRKMFCGCKNDPDQEQPNTNVCPVCMAHPGTLPVPNKQAIEHVIRVGLALGGAIADFSEFDRKNYFYPDIPKGYQISQYKYPIVTGGEVAGVAITRVHLEEDTANSKHDRGAFSLVDFNRAGVPLMELVTEPVIHSAKQAGDFGRELQLLFRYLGVSEANMEKGQMRVELNISVSDDPEKFGTKVEVKNINSFRAVERAAECEIARMTALLEDGKGDEIVQETRGWDENKQATFSQRKKENSQDYRYFPDPDIPKMRLHEAFNLDALRDGLPELPTEKRVRYVDNFGIKSEDIEVYIADMTLATWFEGVAGALTDKDQIKIASNFIVSDILGFLKKDATLQLPDTTSFSTVVKMYTENKLSSRAVKDLLLIMMSQSIDPETYAQEHGMIQQNDEGPVKEMLAKLIEAHPSVVADYKSGKENALMFFVGQVMKESKGSANPAMVKKLLLEMLG
ncbi:Asp-tRNA(Asn)/Glu-tRNA(Gln) amidotransferase subunit GatB [Candidatus Nomurabacteria bacterium]|nr:Asp-tRNA(Asn)/Glu-tRNA(Gln) amidotransferase subunit GatB [Candidatus Nomurabacteria bacterium]